MAISATLNKQSKLVVGLVLLALVLGAGFLFMQSNEKAVSQTVDLPRAWYSADDGQTWFADDANRVVPFDHQGKPACRAYVWTCDGGKTQFVSHLERLSAGARPHFAGKDKVQPWELFPGSLEVKAPLTGERGWVNADSRQAAGIQKPRCPDGKPGIPQPVAAE